MSQAKVNLWDTMKVFRIGTDGRKVPQYMQILPQFTDSQGEPYATSHEAAEGMLTHFAKTEGGFLVTPDTLITQVLEETKLRLQTVHYRFVSDLPSLQNVEAALRAAKGRSAPGPDGASVDLLRLLKGWAVKQLFALFLKTAMCRIAPVQYRGGELFELYKGKGTHTLFANFRSILLSDCVGKISSRSYRSAAIPQIALF